MDLEYLFQADNKQFVLPVNGLYSDQYLLTESLKRSLISMSDQMVYQDHILSVSEYIYLKHREHGGRLYQIPITTVGRDTRIIKSHQITMRDKYNITRLYYKQQNQALLDQFYSNDDEQNILKFICGKDKPKNIELLLLKYLNCDFYYIDSQGTTFIHSLLAYMYSPGAKYSIDELLTYVFKNNKLLSLLEHLVKIDDDQENLP